MDVSLLLSFIMAPTPLVSPMRLARTCSTLLCLCLIYPARFLYIPYHTTPCRDGLPVADLFAIAFALHPSPPLHVSFLPVTIQPNLL